MREVEVKFAVDSDFRLPDLLSIPINGTHVEAASREEVELRATYLDTDDLRLARAGITVRRRTGGGKDGWQVKLPTGTIGTRDEIDFPVAATTKKAAGTAGSSRAGSSAAGSSKGRSTAAARRPVRAAASDGETRPPEDLLDLVRAYVRNAQLRPVSTLLTSRTAVLLRDRDGAPLAEVVDDDVQVLHGADGEQVTVRFREVEVEDRGGGEVTLRAVGEVLRGAGAVSGEFTPKVVRAIGAQASSPADPPPAEKVGPKTPAGGTVTGYLRSNVRRLLEQDPQVRLDSEDAVHQMRVATRRLRSGLRTFGPLLDESWTTPLRAELKWLGSALGDARDLEVLLERLRAQIAALPDDVVRGKPLAVVERRLTAELAGARERALEALRTDRYVDLVEQLIAGATAPPLTKEATRASADVLPGLVRKSWKRLDKKASVAVGGRGEPSDYHAVRIAAKRARYAGEAVTPALGKQAKRFAKKMEKVQDLLGEGQDAVVASHALLDLSVRPGVGSAGFTLGVLYAQQEHAAEQARDDFDDVWAKVSKGKYRRWLKS